MERISELLDLSGLFSALLLHPRRDRKSLSYTGGIRVSGLDFGYPCPYGALESYLTKDGRRVMTRDPGDDLWAQTFDWLAPEPSLAHLNADTKGDFLELTLAAAAQVLDCAEKPCSEPLMRCLHAARLLIEDAARTLEEPAVGQPAPAESDAGGRWVQRQLQVLPKVRRRSLRAVAVCHVGRLIGRRRSACLLGKKMTYKKCPSLQSGMLCRSASSAVAARAISSHSAATAP